MSKTRASIVIPTYNRQDLLRQTLQSIVDCEPNSDDFEVIVSDDGSSDETFEAVRSFEDRLRIKYVYMPDDGFRAARARNLGAALAEGPILIFCDAGTLALPGFVSNHCRAHEAAPNSYVIGLVYGMHRNGEIKQRLAAVLDQNPVSTIAAEITSDPDYADARNRCYQSCSDDLMSLWAPWALAWTANVSIARETFARVGGFDDAYRSWGVEDVDLALTLFQAGIPVTLARGAAVVHHPHEMAVDGVRTNTSNKHYLHAKFGLPQTEAFISSTAIALNLESQEARST